MIGNIQHFHYEIFASLQDITSPATNVLYLIGPTGSGSDKYEEYVYANNTFTKIGDTTIDLSGYVTTQALNTALADYVPSTDLTTLLSGKQDKIDATHKLNADLVDDSSTTHKFVTANEKETWNSKQNALVNGTNIKTINNQSVLGSGNLDVKDIFWVEYYTTPFADILAAYNAGKTLFANYAGMKFVNTAVGIENDSNAFLFSMSGVDENDKIFIFSFAVTSNNGSTDYSNIYSKMLQEELISGTNIKSINNESILGAGNVNFAKYKDTLISSDAITCDTTETVEGVSVYCSNADYYLQPNQKIVFADTVGDNTLYIINYDDISNPFIISSGKGNISWNNFTNNDVRIQLASSSNVGQILSASRYWRGTDNVFIVEYNVTTYQQVLDAYNAGKIVIAIKGDLILTLSRNYDQKFYFGSVVGNVSYNVEVSKNNQWFYHAPTIETVSNKATDFTTINNTKYPSIQAVANYAQPLPFIVNVTINPEGTSYTIDKTMTAIVTAHTTHKQLRLHCLWSQYSIEFEEDLCMFTTVDEQQNQHNYFVAHTVTEGIHYIVTIYYEDSTTKVRYQRVLDSDKQDVISDLSTIRSGAAAGATAYQKPQSGIPASDIAAGVIPDVSNFITNSVNNLVNYYLKSETYTKQEVSDLIGAINQFHYEVHPSLADITTPESNVLYLIGPQGAGTDLYEEYVYPNSTQGFTKIGDTSIDLSGYVTLAYLNTELVKYAKTNEYYPEMRVGSADKVLARIEDTDTYLIRETGGADNEVLNGEAPVLGFEGNAIGWNQLVQNGDFSDGTTSWVIDDPTGTLSVNDGIATAANVNSSSLTQNCKIAANHKLYVSFDVKSQFANVVRFGYGGVISTATTINTTAGVWNSVRRVDTVASNEMSRVLLYFNLNNCPNHSHPVQFRNIYLIDLTLLNPTLAAKANLTVADVEDYLAHNIGFKPYYAYNPGTLLPASITGVSSIKSVNLLNPTTKQARLIPYSTTEGVDNQYTVKRLPDEAALSFTPDITGVAESVTIDSNGHFVIPSVGTLYVVSGGNPYSGDVSGTYVCITWDGTKDGTPDAFEEDVAEIDFAEIYSDNNGVKTQVCPTGMKMADFAGTVRDKLILNDNGKWEFVKNVGDVDLGNIEGDWSYYSSGGTDVFYKNFSDKKAGIDNLICGKYPVLNKTNLWGDMPDKSINGAPSSDSFISIKDSSYTDATTFKASLSGVYLFYELATPVTYTNLYYKTGVDTYVPLEDYIPATYVNNWATQSVNTYPYVDGTPVAIPPRITQEFIIDQEESLDTIKADIIALSENKEDKSNKVTSLSSNSTDVQYPSAKCVYDAIQTELGNINSILETI